MPTRTTKMRKNAMPPSEHVSIHGPLPRIDAEYASDAPGDGHPRRVAVFGGSFDPIHNGHIYIAGEVLRRDLAEEVLFVPAKLPPHKLNSPLTEAAHRYAMIEAAIAPYTRFSVSDIEIRRTEDSPSYTIETLETLRAVYPEAVLLFMMGMDSLADLHNWYRASELVTHFAFIVFQRPGVAPPAFSELSTRFGWKNGRKLVNAILDAPSIPISARKIREWHRVGKSLAGLVPESVLDYIQSYRLYLPAQPGPGPTDESHGEKPETAPEGETAAGM